MIPVVTPARMAQIDASASVSTEVLIERAGAAVARTASAMMSGHYGRRVVVLAGPGNNGADGRAAARMLSRRGARVQVTDALDAPSKLRPADLYIDAAFGTGLSRPYQPPERGRSDAPVLAVDIVSGLHGGSGEMLGGPLWRAERTVALAALKPGLLLGRGPAFCGRVTVADIGLAADTEDAAACALLTGDDVAPLPAGTGATHKWESAALVVAGSSGMTGAASLACSAALRSGAAIVHLSSPTPAAVHPLEVVHHQPPLRVDARRFKVCAAGPGLGGGPQAAERLAEALELQLPTVVDADGLRLLRAPAVAAALGRRRAGGAPLVLTPHDGEYEALMSAPPGGDRIAAVRAAAARFDAVVLLKGGPTLVADAAGRVRIIASGDARLATAGSGDVLTGVIAGRIAGLGAEDLTQRVAEAACLHARAAAAIGGARLVAGDLVDALRAVTP
ncbi:MAG: NAD(P)H-hydrate dehydratase [Acidimicrobiaceae bacterium]|nr:NAD(P)H-hydrate dehydratase [Acidimicrobiaceae bacterium]